MAIEKAVLQGELKALGVEFHPSLGEKKLAKLLVETLKAQGKEPNEELTAFVAAENTGEQNGKTSKHKTLVRLKHDGVLYMPGETVELEKAQADELRKLKCIE